MKRWPKKFVAPDVIWREEVKHRREVIAQRQRMHDAMRAAGRPQPRREEASA